MPSLDEMYPEMSARIAYAEAFGVALREAGLDVRLAEAACWRGDVQAIEKLSRQLIARLEARTEESRRGKRQLVGRKEHIADSTVNLVAYEMLAACNRQNVAPPTELCQLLHHQLSIAKRPLSAREKPLARGHAATVVARDPQITIRALARIVGVQPSTVMHWRQDPGFQRFVDNVRESPSSAP